MYSTPGQGPRSNSSDPNRRAPQHLPAPVKAAGGQHQGHLSQSKGHGKDHDWMHLLMCAPMLLVVVGYLWAGRAHLGSGGILAAIVPALGCIVMMWLMMRLMDRGSAPGPHH